MSKPVTLFHWSRWSHSDKVTRDSANPLTPASRISTQRAMEATAIADLPGARQFRLLLQSDPRHRGRARQSKRLPTTLAGPSGLTRPTVISATQQARLSDVIGLGRRHRRVMPAKRRQLSFLLPRGCTNTGWHGLCPTSRHLTKAHHPKGWDAKPLV